MRHNLLIVERIVLESLSKRSKNIREVCHDTGLTTGLVGNIMTLLVQRGFLRYVEGRYCVVDRENWSTSPQIHEEVKEIFVAMVNRYFVKEKTPAASLAVRKVYMNPLEEKVYEDLVAKMNQFLSQLEENHARSEINRYKTSEQKVIVWGKAPYSELVEEVLKAV
jgi:hypothetical protein